MPDKPPAPGQTSVTTDAPGAAADSLAKAPPAPPRKPDLVALLTLGGLLLVFLAGWWLFPKVAAYMSMQDCLASFRTPASCR
jgi:hypothetical protein